MQIILMVWRITWFLFCSWTPKFINPWRIIILKLFGAKVSGIPFVHSTVQITIPWHLKLSHRACLGEKVCAYTLGEIEIGESATVAQEVYLCTGTHDFNIQSMQLITKKITIQNNSFIGVRTMVLPGVTIGKNAVIGAQSLVSKNIPNGEIWAGNPAKMIGVRRIDQ